MIGKRKEHLVLVELINNLEFSLFLFADRGPLNT